MHAEEPRTETKMKLVQSPAPSLERAALEATLAAAALFEERGDPSRALELVTMGLLREVGKRNWKLLNQFLAELDPAKYSYRLMRGVNGIVVEHVDRLPKYLGFQERMLQRGRVAMAAAPGSFRSGF